MTRAAVVPVLSVLLAARADAAFVDHQSATFEPNFEVSGDWMGAGAGFVDVDGDGWEDVVFVHANAGLYLYRNGGPPDFAFTDVTDGSGLADDLENATGVGAADFDRDGDPDLFMAERRGLRLYRNDGDLAFTDVTADALPGLPWYAITIAFADVDGDGWIDVYASGYTSYVDFPFHEGSPSILLHNQGDGTFVDVAASWGALDEGCTLAVLASDYDRDGDPDLLAANDFGQFVRPNSLFRNDGLAPDGTVRFTDVSESSGFDQRVYGMGLGTADVDENGRADYFTTSFGRTVLLLGQEDGTFLDATEDYGVMGLHPDKAWRVTWGAAMLDVEMDGAWDLAVASGYIPAAPQINDETNQPSLLYAALAPGWAGNPATELAEELGVAPPDASRSVAVGDFDLDGDSDLATAAIGGFTHVFQNAGEGGPVARVHLEGTVSNTDAFGSLATLRCGDVVRTREKFSGGAYASSHGGELRMPLEGCDAGGTLTVRWPSGLEQEFAVDASDVAFDLVEPSFLEADPAWLPADGSSESVVRVTPGTGAGRAVTIEATAGSVGAVSDLGDGTYEARLRAPASPGDAAITVTVDGTPFDAHPRVRFLDDRTTVHLFPRAAVPGADVVATVVPRDANGALEGAGLDVAVEVDGGAIAGEVADLGDGRYRATVQGDGSAPLAVRARVDGVVRGADEVPVMLGIDPDRTRIFAEPAYVDALEVAFARIGIVVSPRDGQGAIPRDFMDREVGVLGAGGEAMTIVDTSTRGSALVRWVGAEELLARGPATIVIDGVPMTTTVSLAAYDDPAELLDRVDPATSHIGPFFQSAYADGADTNWIAVELRDAAGGSVPIGDWVTYATDRMDVVQTVFGSSGRDGKAKLRAGLEPGEAWIEVEIDGVPTGVSTWIDLLPARDVDLDRLSLEACVAQTYWDLERGGEVPIEIRPHWEDGDLVGSNVAIWATRNGEDLPVVYDERGEYRAWIANAGLPRRDVVQVGLDGTDEEVTLWIEFGEGREGGDPDLPKCASSDEPFDLPDAGPDGGDAGSDSDADSDGDGDADPGEPPQSARGGGCTCDATGGGSFWSLATFVVLAASQFRARARARARL